MGELHRGGLRAARLAEIVAAKVVAAALALTVSLLPAQSGEPKPAGAAAEVAPGLRDQLVVALQEFFADPDASGSLLGAVKKLARGREALLVDVLRSKAFVSLSQDAIGRRGRLVAGRFVDSDDLEAANPALLFGPATDVPAAADGSSLLPLVVYVPDALDSKPYVHELRREAWEQRRFVLLVPDPRRDNLWKPGPDEILRHTGAIRELLLQYPIDPNRLYFVGSGRGGHAAWDVGLMRSGLWAGIYPCNGGLIHEGGFAVTGGVFVENAKDLSVFTVYNTKFDHGIESCRYAAKLLEKWGCRFERVEESRLRLMGLAEAMTKLDIVTRRAHPRTVTKRFNRIADGAHYWLEAKKRKPREWNPKSRIEIRGKWPSDPVKQRQVVWREVQRQCARLHGVIAGNAIRIETQGIGRLRVWLDPELIDFDRKVAITCNGKKQRKHQPKRRIDVMLSRLHATGDTARLYWDYVDFTVR
ncbi:MAG: hypothetical protein AB8H80_05805 [Planctomycetota bacterium]